MPTSLLLALICSYGVAFLLGMLVASTTPRRNKSKNIKEYQRFYEKEMREAQQDSWDHPSF